MSAKGQIEDTTQKRATQLYLDICKEYAKVGFPFNVRQVAKLLGVTGKNSTGLAAHYLKILRQWGLVTWEPGIACTIRPCELPNYPPVEYRELDHGKL